MGYGRVLARPGGRVRMVRAGKDNLAIPFVGWMNQKDLILAGCSKGQTSHPPSPGGYFTRPP
jgi:hypothetical protein